MKKKGFSLTSSLAVLFLFFIGTSSISASTGKSPDYKPVADEMIEASGITWMAKVNYTGLVLSVSRPDGTVIEKNFDSVRNPHINLSELLKDNPGDGLNTYKLRVIPAAGKDNPIRKPLTQTGYFSIQGGSIESPPNPNEDISITPTPDCFDEVVIEGPLCVGSGCECMPIGGSDEIIFKGSEPIFLFRDTRGDQNSFSCWRIHIDDDNADDGYFAIEDKQCLDPNVCNVKVFTIEEDAEEHSLYIAKNGKVGIGTDTPSAQLSIEDDGPTKIALNNTTATKWNINSANNNTFRINVDNNPNILFTLTNTGDLTIEGDITSRSGSCCGADYVFDSDYTLMPITKLAEFIKKEKHLPNIPSAEEMREKGVNMNQLQMKLLEKVEELTLYILSQQEIINSLKARIAILEKK